MMNMNEKNMKILLKIILLNKIRKLILNYYKLNDIKIF